MSATHDRNRPGGLLTGIQRAYLDTFVAPRWNPDLDGVNRDQHYDLDETATVKIRPANYTEQITALLMERPESFADLMDRFIEECRGEVGE